MGGKSPPYNSPNSSALATAAGQIEAVKLVDPTDLGARSVSQDKAIDVTLPPLGVLFFRRNAD